MSMLILATFLFVGGHLILSAPPVRQPLVARLGSGGFMGAYSLISAGSLVWMILAFRSAPYDPVLWHLGPAVDGMNHLFVLIAVLLLVLGYSQKNPTAIGQADGLAAEDPARGIIRLTRHPVMWGIAVWAFGHLLANGEMRMVIITVGMLILTLGGAASLDWKGRITKPDVAPRFQAMTSFVPGAALLAGKQSTGAMLREIGILRPLLALIVYTALLYTHAWYTGIAVIG